MDGQARQRRGCAFSTSERVGQDGVSLDPLHLCPDGSSLEWDLLVGLADAHGNQHRSHKTADPGVDGRSLQRWRSI